MRILKQISLLLSLNEGGAVVHLGACYQHDPSIVARDIAGEMILVPIRKNVGDLEHIYTLNETASTIWDLLDGQRPLTEIRDAVVAEYEVTPEEAEQDLQELIAHFVRIGVVERVDG
jgi:hypothetical protein